MNDLKESLAQEECETIKTKSPQGPVDNCGDGFSGADQAHVPKQCGSY